MALKKRSRNKLFDQLRIFGFSNYNEFLTSSLWSEFKRHFRSVEDCSKCRKCGSTEGINFHHTSYNRLLDPKNIVILCRECHLNQHEIKEGIRHEMPYDYTLDPKDKKKRYC